MDIFINNNRGEKLAVAIHGQENIGKGKLVFVQHGLSGHKGQTMVKAPLRAFVDNGYVAVSFDSRHSFGKSSGSLEFATLSSFIEDLETIIDWAKTQDFYAEPFALSGHSLGGGSITRFAENYPDKVSLLVPVSAMVGGKYFIRSRLLNEAKAYKIWKEKGIIYRENKNHPELNGWLSFNVVKDMLRYDLVREAGRIKAKTLLITGEKDLSSTVYNNTKLYENLQGNKNLVVLKDCAHLYEHKENVTELYETVKNWVKENV